MLRVDADGAHVALIGRLDRRRRLVWSMPKGHLEEGDPSGKDATRAMLSDADIEVEEVAWVPLEELPTRLGYADERRLLNRVPALIHESGLTVADDVLAALDVRRPPGTTGADTA